MIKNGAMIEVSWLKKCFHERLKTFLLNKLPFFCIHYLNEFVLSLNKKCSNLFLNHMDSKEAQSSHMKLCFKGFCQVSVHSSDIAWSDFTFSRFWPNIVSYRFLFGPYESFGVLEEVYLTLRHQTQFKNPWKSKIH